MNFKSPFQGKAASALIRPRKNERLYEMAEEWLMKLISLHRHSLASRHLAMPIVCEIPIANLTRDEFIERDDLIMECAYASQNKLGRLCDERVYENDLAERLKAAGMRNVWTQVPFRVTHGSFTKEYLLDLVADDAVYELKTVALYTGAHFSQVLNYAMCLDVRFIKLLNFRPSKLDGKLRASAVTHVDRHAARIICDSWQPLSPRCHLLKDHLHALVADIGGYLAVSLYDEALSFLTAAPETRLTVSRDGRDLGTHSLHNSCD